MASNKSQKPVENSRIEKKETDPLGQRNSGQIFVPQKPIIPIYPNEISNPSPKLPERVTQNDNRQIWN